MAGYLQTTETSTTLNIKTTAAPFFEIEFDEAKGGVIDVWYTGDGGSTNYADSTNGLFAHFLNDGSDRPQHSATGTVMTVKENTPNRVWVHFEGTLTTNVTFVQDVYIYPHGFLHYHTEVTNSTGGSITGEAGGVRINTDATNYASDTEIADNSSDATPTYNTEYWFGQYASTLNTVVCAIVNASTQAQQDTYANSANSNEYHNASPTFTTGTSYTHTSVLYIGGTSATEANIQGDIDEKVDLAMAAPTTGSEVTDLVIPYDLSSDGFASDGGRHLEMSSDEIEYTVDIARVGHVDVIEDPPIETGTVGSSTDHLLNHYKCDDNAANTTLTDTTGNQNLTLPANSSTLTQTDSIRNRSILMQDTNINANSLISGLSDTSEFTFMAWVKPNFSYTGTEPILSYGSDYGVDYNDYFAFQYRGTNGFSIYNNISSANTYLDSGSLFSSDAEFQQWMHIMLSVDLNNDFMQISLNGEVILNEVITDAWNATPNWLMISRLNWGAGSRGNYYWDDVKLIDGCLLPYGAYFTGNGSVDTDHAHSDITCYVAGTESHDDALSIGTGNIDVVNATSETGIFDTAFLTDANGEYIQVDDGNVTDAQGAISFWYKASASPSANAMFFADDSTYTELCAYRYTSTDVRYQINGTTIDFTPTVSNLWDQNWYHLKFTWDTVNDYHTLWINGELSNESTSSTGTPTVSALMFGNGGSAGTTYHSGYFERIFITNNPNTPQIPVILGSGPIHMPIRGVE